MWLITQNSKNCYMDLDVFDHQEKVRYSGNRKWERDNGAYTYGDSSVPLNLEAAQAW